MRDSKPSNVAYFALMGFSAATGLARGIVIALLLEVASFGVYAVVVSLSAFLSKAVSFGRVEATMKSFPRLWHAGHGAQTLPQADAIARVLAIPLVVLMMAALLLAELAGYQQWLPAILLTGACAFSIALSTIYASVLRGSGWIGDLGLASAVRTVAALCLAGLGAAVASWRGALLGEVVAAAGSALLMRTLASRRAATATTEHASMPVDAGAGGVWLYWALLLGAVPFYVDRLFVAWLFGAAVAGSYAFVMMLPFAASTLVAMVVPKVGPDLVRMAGDHGAGLVQTRHAVRWSAACVILIMLGAAVATCALVYWPLAWLGERYGVSLGLMALVAGLSALHITPILDWLLIARDREREVLIATSANLALTIAAALATVILHGSIAMLIAGLVIAKAVQVSLQIAFARREAGPAPVS